MPDDTGVLRGGTGALGIVTAQFLSEEGAKSLSLLSRGGTPSSDALGQWEWLQKSKVEVLVSKCDAGQAASVQELAESLAG